MKLDREKLMLAMARKEMNVNDLSESSGIGANSISNYRSGRTNPSGKSLGKMAHALGVDVAELLENEKE